MTAAPSGAIPACAPCLNRKPAISSFFSIRWILQSQKLQEQLLDRIVELDYDIITEIDILQQTHRPVSCDERCKDTVPNPGIFQKKYVLSQTGLWTIRPETNTYFKLDFDYMQKRLADDDTYSFIVEMKKYERRIEGKAVSAFLYQQRAEAGVPGKGTM